MVMQCKEKASQFQGKAETDKHLIRQGSITRLCPKTPSSGPRASVFLPGKDGEAGDVGFIVDAAGCSQSENKPLEARWGFLTEPNFREGPEQEHKGQLT